MSEIDWNKAPEGATHYCHARKDWLNYHVDSIDDCCIPRPTKQEWEGGLPPIGSYSRISRKNDVRPSDLVVKIVCYTGQLVIVENDVGTEYALSKDQVSFGPEISKAERQMEGLANLIDENYGNSGTGIADAILSRYNLEPKA